MCGIAGYWNPASPLTAESATAAITAMTNTLFKRGPDSGGAWISRCDGLALGMRRLAIRDLSPAGSQPMREKDADCCLVYNGEIYNADELREELSSSGCVFLGNSDTEVVLHACIHWGVENALEKLLGMYAFAFWDGSQKRLTLARDRFGVKPLYWGFANGLFLFASDLRPFHMHPDWRAEIDRNALVALLRYSYIPAPQSIYRNVYKLETGSLLSVGSDGSITKERYWDALDDVLEGQGKPFDGTPEELTDELDGLVSDAVKRRLVADVPVGAFLSGGIDSSLVVAMMQKHLPDPAHTFSIGFAEEGFDEAPFARAIANHLGTHYTETYFTAQDLLNILPSMPSYYSEPFADQSQLPASLVSMKTREHVTVALSGDGGDELFAGYDYRYLCPLSSSEQGPLWRKFFSKSIRTIPPSMLTSVCGRFHSKGKFARIGERLHNYALNAVGSRVAQYHTRFLSMWWYPESVVVGASYDGGIWKEKEKKSKLIRDSLSYRQYADVIQYLPDSILTKVDRASMAYSLEVRVPLLDHRLYRLACSIPPEWRFQGQTGKLPLRKVLERYIPRELFDRPKQGFRVPLETWLRTSLREWAQELLEPERLKREGYFVPEQVDYAWNRHLSGKSDWQSMLWCVLMFQQWLESDKKKPPVYYDIEIRIE